ncbi:ferritin [Geothermobacter hydrogeniphilus]|uniref:Ferritin n=1 Tax=Geothermobacter hydrogeniphilus TaxID=1969733 RepID=A0A1X0Y526_9BACT|nr:ferritin [Geothermobacter hydrogeniphilus]ORJ60265.1 ferritin [Geothermobacter hydrogeniphilus]
MLSDKLQGALNEQMKNEFYSAYLYLAIAGYFESEDLPGIASWMRIQALEELTHGEKFFNFITEAGGRTDLRGFDAPQNGFDSPLAAFQYSLEHERFVTASINKLMDLARDEGNHAAQIFLQWFVTEQVEEESNFGLILRKLERIGDDGNGLLRLDEELGARTFVAPAPA